MAAKSEKSEAEKYSHQTVNYQNPSRHQGEFCARCEHFISPDHCTGVKYPIAGGAWCARFDGK